MKNPIVSSAIVLAGGKGTRLQSLVHDMPKPMAPIGDFPFLHYQLIWLAQNNIKNIYVSVGYKYQTIINYFGNSFKGMSLHYIIEDSPLGTGGAIKKCLTQIQDLVFIVNGDTFFPIVLQDLLNFHLHSKSNISIALKKISNSDRYGTVSMNQNKIIQFNEKKYIDNGLINGGIYLCDSNIFNDYQFKESFSFESDFLQKYTNELDLYGKTYNDYFIDIGIPEDFIKAQYEIPLIL